MWMSIREDQKLLHGLAYGNIQRMFHYHQLPTNSNGIIKYTDMHGKRHQTDLTYQCDNLTKELAVRFDKSGPNPEA